MQAEALLQGRKEADEDKQKTIAMVVETIGIADRSRKGGLSSLRDVGEENSVKINGEAMPHKSLSERIQPEKEKAEEEQTVVTGMYRITKMTINFKDKSASADIFEVQTGDPIHGLVVQPKSIYDGSYKVLKKAQNNKDVELQLIVTKRNGYMVKAILDKVL
jgi:hypothetical protein